jgi:hypothetical protein
MQCINNDTHHLKQTNNDDSDSEIDMEIDMESE